MKSVYTIREYGSFIADKEVKGYETLPQKTFEQLENFILSNSSKDTDALELMSLSARKGLGKIITARNYVGMIAMNDGTVIEILPKVCSVLEDTPDNQKAKKLLLDMLKTLRNSPYKTLQTTNVNIEKLNIFEIFIRMFLDEVFYIVKRGLKCSYETVEENGVFFRGKMIFSRQIQKNQIHKEHCYVTYDVFTANRPENRLLKAALLYLYKHSASSRNRTDMKTLLSVFSDVDASVDYKGDFAKYKPDRNMKDYTNALLWSRVFLMGKSFTSFVGSEVAAALLFPMETLYESYIAALLKKRLQRNEFEIRIQDRTYHLFEQPGKKFLMKPDIVITRKSDNAVFILDTKWKLLSDALPNWGISQGDMYQMYAYHKKYEAERVMLLYPGTDNVSDAGMEFCSEDNARVHICFADLFDIEQSVNRVISIFRSVEGPGDVI